LFVFGSLVQARVKTLSGALVLQAFGQTQVRLATKLSL
jgi:hypothetical protein